MLTAEGQVHKRFKSYLSWQWKEIEIPMPNGMFGVFIWKSVGTLDALANISEQFWCLGFNYKRQGEMGLEWAFNVQAHFFMSALHEGFLEASLGI